MKSGRLVGSERIKAALAIAKTRGVKFGGAAVRQTPNQSCNSQSVSSRALLGMARWGLYPLVLLVTFAPTPRTIDAAEAMAAG